MRSRRFSKWQLGGAVAAAILAVRCGSGSEDTPRAKPAARASVPAAVALASEPAGAKPVHELVASAKPGDEVVAIGRVGDAGSDRADFLLVDPVLKSCTDLGDQCETPWDYCCAAPEEKRANSAVVVLRDEHGVPLSGTILGFAGLDHLGTVVVRGRAEPDAAGNLTIVATGLFVKH
jgi:hypothetical protein